MDPSAVKPNEFTLSSTTSLEASGILGIPQNGVQIHGVCAKSNFSEGNRWARNTNTNTDKDFHTAQSTIAGVLVDRQSHFACMVDLLGRAAMHLIEKMTIKPNVGIWQIVVSGS
ncbi:unnamed protein product [Lupinus luteus]|uniref:Uncharacterized protein n=1 Tax=Lupinus luteus TaxID=3873 RepID=A0AAV1W9K3_LUPLU